jgi:hypothetical protein
LTHLVAPDFSSPGGVPSSDAYLLLDVASAGLTLNWVGAGARFRSRLSTDTVVMLADDLQQLCTTLKHLVAVVDRSVQRVPLDRIKYPCYGCKDRMCVQSTSCQQQPSSDNGDSTVTVTAASAVQLQRQQYENVVGDEHAYDDMDNSIPHIDSDPEDVAQDSRHQKVDNNVAGESC